MKVTELRLGNLIERKIQDELDERKEWWEVSKVDFNVLTWLDSFPEDDDFRLIKISEEWLLKFEFYKDGAVFTIKPNEDENLFIIKSFNYNMFGMLIDINDEIPFIYLSNINKLQNLYFALTGEELTQVR